MGDHDEGPWRTTTVATPTSGARCGSERLAWCSTRRCALIALGCVVLVVAIFFATIWIGAEIEIQKMRGVPGTSWLYASTDVCAAVSGTAGDILTLASEDAAPAQTGVHVMHCGACGECSTITDIALYNRTRYTLTRSATRCALQYFVNGRRSVDECFTSIGFSPACRECWVENVACDMSNCFFTCLRHVIQGMSPQAHIRNLPYCCELQSSPLHVDTRNDCCGARQRLCGRAGEMRPLRLNAQQS